MVVSPGSLGASAIPLGDRTLRDPLFQGYGVNQNGGRIAVANVDRENLIRSPAMLRVYALTFVIGLVIGMGLVIGPLLVRHGAQPLRPAVAWTPQRAVTSPPASPFVAPKPSPTATSPPASPFAATPLHGSRPPASPPLAASPANPAHQVTVPGAPGTTASSEVGTAAPETAPSSSFLVIPSPDTAAAVGAIQQAAGQSPRFHVQVGVFKAREDAQALVQRLQSLGYSATSAEGDVYQVWVGGYFDRETAERLAANLHKAGFESVLVP